MYSSLEPVFVWAVIIAICGLIGVKGGMPERLAALSLVGAALLVMAIHAFAPKGLQSLLLLADDGGLAIAFLFLSLRYLSPWLGVAMMLQAGQFSLHAYYLVGERSHDRLYAVVNNVNTLGVLACILVGTLIAWRRRAGAAN